MIVYTLLFLGALLWHGGLDHASWKALFASVLFRIAASCSWCRSL